MNREDEARVLEYHREKYQDATKDKLLAVVGAADARWRCWEEFGAQEDACLEYENELDKALANCPGTSAWHFAKKPIEEWKGDKDE